MAGASTSSVPVNGAAVGGESKELLDVARSVQQLFLESLENGGHSDYDDVDIQHVKHNLEYVCLFVKQKMGNKEEAYSMMVDALKWRKEFGVNDMKLNQLDHTYFHNGLAFPHGEDKQGNTLVILNIHLHKKDAKKTIDQRRFLVFCLESHARRFPGKRVTLIFNMSQCGLSNMDMDFVKFLITCFKCYYPSMLGWLLVFEMPWILQAAWKIIKTWLSEAAVRKIKFVTKSDITEYIDPGQLLRELGGVDDWVYSCDMDEIEREAASVWRREANLSSSALAGMMNGEEKKVGREEEKEEEEEESMESSRRQVRFAPGLPPTHQSRYGSEEEESLYRPRSPKEAQLLRGSAVSPNYRRRQVNRLINMQQTSLEQRSSPSQSPNHSLDTQNSLIGSLDAAGRKDDTVMPSFLSISPSHELLFCGDLSEQLYCTLQLTNKSDQTVAYKIKTTAPLRYKVRPNINLIEPMSVTSVQVLLVSGASSGPVSEDKFLIQTYQLQPGASVSVQDLSSTWKSLPRNEMKEFRMKCRHSTDVKPPVEPKPHPPSTTPTSSVTKQQASPVTNESRTLQLVCAKLDQLTAANTHVLSKLTQLWYLQIFLIVLIIFVLISIFLLFPQSQL